MDVNHECNDETVSVDKQDVNDPCRKIKELMDVSIANDENLDHGQLNGCDAPELTENHKSDDKTVEPNKDMGEEETKEQVTSTVDDQSKEEVGSCLTGNSVKDSDSVKDSSSTEYQYDDQSDMIDCQSEAQSISSSHGYTTHSTVGSVSAPYKSLNNVELDSSSSSDDSSNDSQSDFESEASCDEDIAESKDSVSNEWKITSTSEENVDDEGGRETQQIDKSASGKDASAKPKSHLNGGCNINKYIISLESEKNIYITGATLLTIKGIISYEEYITNNIKKDIPRETLEKKFYVRDILGAIRGMTRLKLALDSARYPSITMYENMKKEDEEIIACGGKFVSDSEEEIDDVSARDELANDGSTNGHTSVKKEADEISENESKSSRSKLPKMKGLSIALEKFEAQFTGNQMTFNNNNNFGTDKSVKKVTELKRSRRDDEDSDDGDDSSMLSGQGNDNPLPDELVNCGSCGVTITSLQHLDRHLERCRGFKNKQQNKLHAKRQRTSQEDEQTENCGKLFVRDTEDGEVIEGWCPPMGAIPPGPTCPRCAFEVPTLYDLPLHQRHHTGMDCLTCPVCPFSTTSIPAYLIHVEDHAT